MFVLLLLLSPLFWWIMFQLNKVVLDWLGFPRFVIEKITTFYSEERVVSVGLMRWSNIDTGVLAVLSKVMYNKLTLFIPELFSYLSYLSPRIYFQAGEGSVYSPLGVEPIPTVLFPLFIYGLLVVIRRKNFKLLKWTAVFAFIAYLTDKKIFSYLFPIAFMYLYIAVIGLNNFSNKYKTVGVILISIYSLFVLGRAIWIKY